MYIDRNLLVPAPPQTFPHTEVEAKSSVTKDVYRRHIPTRLLVSICNVVGFQYMQCCWLLLNG